MILLLGCHQPEPTAAPSPLVPLSDTRLARRMSIDILGRLPTEDELDRAQEPGGIAALRDEWLADPGFETHLVDVFADSWQLRADELRVGPEEFGYDLSENYAYTRAIGDEPAHFLAHIAAADRPYTDIVTADTTMANAKLAEMVQLEWVDPDSTDEWREARYTDGRPAGGVLMTSGLWLRYPTTIFNFNRGRAATLAKLLLCYDYLGRPVLFSDVADDSQAGLLAAVQSDPGCLACHASLDSLAGTLFGFWPFEDKDGAELVTYHPEREGYSESLTGATPAYFGTPVTAASQLGELVAADPRFRTCAVSHAAEWLWERTPEEADRRTLTELEHTFEDGDLRYTALTRAVLETDEYRAGSLADTASDADLERYHTLHLMTPNTLADVVEGVTGFRWTLDDWDELDSDYTGYRVLAGGIDGDLVRTPNLEPTLSRSLVIRRLAQAAGRTVAEHDLAAAPADRLLVGTTADDMTTLSADALTALHRRLTGNLPTDAQIEAETTLFDGVLSSTGDTTSAWASLVAVLLRDPDFWTY